MLLRSAIAALCLSFVACSGLQEPWPEPIPLPHPLTDCSGLDEGACNAAPACVAVYGSGEEPQPIPVVGLVSGCLPFEPEQQVPFHHCEQMPPVDSCSGLDEATCSATPGCQPQYVGGGIAVGAPEGTAGADIAVVNVGYAGCASVPVVVDPPVAACPAIGCLLYCEHGEVLDANGCPTCECLP